jgi:hypothetical protein
MAAAPGVAGLIIATKRCANTSDPPTALSALAAQPQPGRTRSTTGYRGVSSQQHTPV